MTRGTRERGICGYIRPGRSGRKEGTGCAFYMHRGRAAYHQMAVTLCGASKYNRKYYFNPDFDRIPDGVKEHLREICVLFAEEVGGVFTIEFNEAGSPKFSVSSGEGGSDIDEIAAELKVRALQRDEAELMDQLSLFYRIFILGEGLDE